MKQFVFDQKLTKITILFLSFVYKHATTRYHRRDATRTQASLPLYSFNMPQKRPSSGNMTQKSLINFFGKPGEKPAKPGAASTPVSKSVLSRPSQLAGGSASSDVESNVRDTPPTSDPIDVDMLSEEQAIKPAKGKPVSSPHLSHSTSLILLLLLRRVISARLSSRIPTTTRMKIQPPLAHLLYIAPPLLTIMTSHPPYEVSFSW